jgi:murein DD-endopeptidase MepM/ murein hydrolase activator NlpD
MDAKILPPNLIGEHGGGLNHTQALAGRPAGEVGERRKIAREFTALLYREVLKSMRAALQQEAQSGGEALPRDMFTSMFDGEAARLMALRDSSGLVKSVERSLERLALPSAAVKSEVPAAARPAVAPVSADRVIASSPIAAAGVISSAYGQRFDPIDGQPRFHRGVDIAAPAGTPINSVAAGRVVFSGVAPGYGNLVEIDHGGGWVTRYAHNAKNLVSTGDVVQVGQRVATVGRTGRATGDHVHFEVQRHGRAVDPKEFLDAVPKGGRVSARI